MESEMARRTFFSFHYKPDVFRANVVKNSWLLKANRDAAGFFDSSAFETAQRTNPDALKRFLDNQLSGSSVTCVLSGAETAHRRWVRYELVRSFCEGKGLLCVRIHTIADAKTQQATVEGPNPLDHLAYRVSDDRVYFQEKNGTTWAEYSDIGPMQLSALRYNLGGRNHHTFSTLFQSYDWQHDGYDQLGNWVESAAQRANR